jgi:hypothetical protein
MFLTKKHLSRRTFIRSSLGATVALPWLDAMVPAQTPLAKTAARPRARFGFIYVPHGSIMKEWTPAQEGTGFEFSPILKPMERFRENLTVLTGLTNAGENGHSPSTAMWLSGTFPAKGSVIRLSTTVDQLIAEHIGQDTTFPSIELATEDHSSHLGSCAGDFLCSYMSTISWRTPTQPLPMEINPRVVFERLFGGDASSPAERKARVERNTSLLDAIGESVADLQRGLGARDRAKLTEYLDNVREIERRIQAVEAQNRSGEKRELPEAPAGVPDSFTEHMKLMFDIQVLALQTDMTRITSFKTGRDAQNRVFPECESNQPFHPASHHGNREERIMEFNKICKFRVGQMAYFLDRMKSTMDGDASLLDKTLIIWGSPMADPNIHNHRRCPLVLFGHANGGLKGNLHLKAPDGTPMANVMLTLLHQLGLDDVKGFGDSTGEFSLSAPAATV